MVLSVASVQTPISEVLIEHHSFCYKCNQILTIFPKTSYDILAWCVLEIPYAESSRSAAVLLYEGHLQGPDSGIRPNTDIEKFSTSRFQARLHQPCMQP